MKITIVETKLVIFSIFLFFTVMMIPAYAEVNSIDLAQSFYRDDERFVFEGIESTGKVSVFVIVRDDDGDYQTMVSAPRSDADGAFSTTGRIVEDIFSSKGTYFATAFTDDQKEKDGLTIELEYDGNQIFLVPDFELELNQFQIKQLKRNKLFRLLAGITESLSGLEYSLDKNPPSGASINSETGKFTWRPSSSQSSGSYSFDIVVEERRIRR